MTPTTQFQYQVNQWLEGSCTLQLVCGPIEGASEAPVLQAEHRTVRQVGNFSSVRLIGFLFPKEYPVFDTTLHDGQSINLIFDTPLSCSVNITCDWINPINKCVGVKLLGTPGGVLLTLPEGGSMDWMFYLPPVT